MATLLPPVPAWWPLTFSFKSSITRCLCSGSMSYIFKTFPSLILTTLFAKYLRPWSCVTIIIVIPDFTFKSTKIFIIMSVDFVSRSPVGSSSNKIEGLFEIERAIVTRYYSPPESILGKWSILSSSPTSFNNLVALYLIYVLVNFPRSCIGNSTFSRAVNEPIRLKVWNTKPNLFNLIEASS